MGRQASSGASAGHHYINFDLILGTEKVGEKDGAGKENKTTDNIDDASKALDLHSKRFTY